MHFQDQYYREVTVLVTTDGERIYVTAGVPVKYINEQLPKQQNRLKPQKLVWYKTIQPYKE